MTNRKIISGLFILTATGLFIWSAQFFKTNIEQAPTPQSKKVKEEAQASFNESARYLHKLKANPYTNKISFSDVMKAHEQANQMPETKKPLGITWENLGPDDVGGRTRAIVVDQSNPNILYAGGVSGGFWKSTNRGRTWERKPYSGNYTNLCVVSMTQASNGDLYFGTGEHDLTVGFLQGERGGTGNVGMGVWKSTDKGENWEQLEATIPTRKFNTNDDWSNVSDIAADPNNPQKIFAGTHGGLKVSTDGGQTWSSNWSEGTLNRSVVLDIKISENGQLVMVATRTVGFRSTDGGNSFQRIDAQNFPSGSGIGRIEFAIAPSDNNYVYASVIRNNGNGGILEGVYQSTDQGDTWNNIGQGGTEAFDPFARSQGDGQGMYNNVIAVDPNDKERIFVGGIDFWRWENGSWNQIASQREFLDNDDQFRNPAYLHVDHHGITFDNQSSEPRMYIGNDGGIFASSDYQTKQPTYQAMNQRYNVTQFYTVEPSPNGNVIVGGTQDNNTLKIETDGFSGSKGRQLFSGDGFYAEISTLKPSVFFFENQHAAFQGGGIQRSNENGNNPEGMFSKYLDPDTPLDDNNIFVDFGFNQRNNFNRIYPFNTPFSLWEEGNDTLTTDSIVFTSDTSVILKAGKVKKPDPELANLYANDDEHFNELGNNRFQARVDISQFPGDTVEVRSENGIFFDFVLPNGLGVSENVKVQDIKQSKFVMAISDEIWLTTDALNFTKTPTWHRIADNTGIGTPTSIDFSDDGRSVIVGGYDRGQGKVIRIDSLRQVDYTAQNANDEFNPSAEGVEFSLIRTFNNVTTGVSFARNNKSKALVTLGNYGVSDHVYYSDNFMDSTQNVNFTNVTANLPAMPVYDALFHAKNSDTVLIGTELGVWGTDDITASTVEWEEQNTNMQRVPVHMIEQIIETPKFENAGPEIYIGTHGRGIFQTSSFNPISGAEDKDELADNKSSDQDMLQLYPNPATQHANVKLNFNNQTTVSGAVYDLSGSRVKTFQIEPQTTAGERTQKVNVADLQPGQYLISVSGDGAQGTAKLIVR